MGGNYDYKYFKKLGMKRNGLLSESLDDFNLAKGDDISITGGQEEYAILGFFYRLNYGYKDRYLFEASGRYDGSSVSVEDIVSVSSRRSLPDGVSVKKPSLHKPKTM